jgi:6-phosphogluconolactonase
MARVQFSKLSYTILVFTAAIYLASCGGALSDRPSPGPGSGSPGNSGSGGTGGSGGPSASGGFAAGIGASGQKSAAQFLYSAPLPGGAPFAGQINQQNGTLTASPNQTSAQAVDPVNMAIDPSGSFLYQAATFSPGGIWGYTINRQNGSLTSMANSPFSADQNFFSVAIDPLGKFLYAEGSTEIFGYSIQSGTGELMRIPGSPFAAAGPSNPFNLPVPLPANRVTVDQMGKFLYASTSGGIFAFTIDANSGALTPIAGSPFGAASSLPFAIVVIPSNQFLYASSGDGSQSVHGFSLNQSTGALTEISGSPFAGCGLIDNMTIAAQGKFIYTNCGDFSVNSSTGALNLASSFSPGDWPVINPTGNFLWAITTADNCFHCNIGVSAYTVDANTGNLTLVPNSFLILTNGEVGSEASLAITK